MLPDSGHIQEMDARWINKKNKKLGREPVEPMYGVKDAEKALDNFAPVGYNEIIQVHPRIKARFRDAGHILGSAIIEVWVDEKGKQTKIVFSGDLGPKGQAIIRDPEVIDDADILLIESTYGNRLHKTREDTYREFKEIILDSHNSRGNIIIPAFAVERTQEIIYALAKMERSKEIPPIPVYIDSPLAISATEIFRKNKDCFDEEARKMVLSGDTPLNFKGLHFSRSTKESKRLNEEAQGAIIISASGMCTAGRIKFHLQNNLYKPNSSVVFVGYQAEGTLGRRIIEGAKQVRLYGEDVAVKAKIHTLGGFSAHADKDGLLEWMRSINNPDLKVFVVHGEEESSLHFAETIKTELELSSFVPRWGEIVDLNNLESVMATYGVSNSYTEIDHEIKSLTRTIEDLAQKYHDTIKEKSLVDTENLQHDLSDLTAMVSMIKDEL